MSRSYDVVRFGLVVAAALCLAACCLGSRSSSSSGSTSTAPPAPPTPPVPPPLPPPAMQVVSGPGWSIGFPPGWRPLMAGNEPTVVANYVEASQGVALAQAAKLFVREMAPGESFLNYRAGVAALVQRRGESVVSQRDVTQGGLPWFEIEYSRPASATRNARRFIERSTAVATRMYIIECALPEATLLVTRPTCEAIFQSFHL